MKLGFHISIRGGFKNVPDRALKSQCETIQIFSRNPRGWKYSKIEENDVKIFKEKIKSYRIFPVFIHLPYLPNLGTSKKELYDLSLSSLKEELKRAEILGVKYVTIHPGASTGSDKKETIERIIEGINKALEEIKNDTIILIENTAGEGSSIGKDFDEIKKIIDGISNKKRVGVVLDTAHLFEAGYRINTEKGLNKTIEEFKRKIGMERLKLLHLNDSRTPCGSKKDRHWHIGRGFIGEDGFKLIVNHPDLRKLPGIMETPRKNLQDDIENMKRIKKLISS